MIAISRVISRRSHGRSRMLRNPSITICPASVPVSVAFCPEKSSATREQRAGQRRAEQRRQQQVGVGDVGDVLVAGAVEGRRGHDQDRAVEEQRRHQRDRRVDRREAHGLAAGWPVESPYLRVWTIDECRYRLCGITVAPRIPTAM